MKIGIVGFGYVGLVSAIVLANSGNDIIGVDIDKNKIKSLKNKKIDIYEPGLDKAFENAYDRITFSTDYSVLKDAGIIYIVVPTPTVNGKIVLDYVFHAAQSIKEVNSNAIIVIKSTVVPGTAKRIYEKTGLKVISNPEFTREGSAVEDTMHPDRIVIGGNDSDAIGIVERIWSFTKAPVLKTSNENAELIKYASNAFLATKISFINEIANLCEKIPDADVDIIAKGMGLDKRIGHYFLKAGIGYGGSCFPKDTEAIAEFARSLDERLKIIESTIEVNKERIERVFKLIKNTCDGKKVKIGILGIAFKDNTNDIRESQALKLIQKLQTEGFEINAYDPIIKNNINGVNTLPTIEECIKLSDLIVIVTEWNQFQNIKTSKLIIDARRILNPYKNNVIPIGFGKADRRVMEQ